ncbi:MAG TPA: 23S rRNA (adenine(2503)-C(2))-methyltransferase RlmN [Thermoanaerobaculia bacterium]|nr:23S rRNA (adenine(2503)-C(2))-methyltransferase RlmN [Thermoanaerobaculia bacterium]
MTEPIPSTGAPKAPRDPRPALLGRTLDELGELLAPVVDKPFRVRQVHDALHRRGSSTFDELTNLPKAMRAELEERFRVGQPEIVERRPADDGTVKYLLRLADGGSIEAVDIPAPEHAGGHHTLCISSQAGCALACAFCVTGYWGAGRDLTAGEIVGQVLAVRRAGELPESLNVVFMGMGEPLLNTDAVETAVELMTGPLGLSPRRITVSTSGIVPAIDRMAGWPRRPNLAISLHAADDDLRSELMPINRTHPLPDLVAALRRFPLDKGRRITIEYILIRNVNDAPRQADALASLLAGIEVKVNLIPINPDPVLGQAMVPPDDAAVDAFHRRLKSHGLVSTVRRPRGDDVSAACGQLRAYAQEPRGFAGRSLGDGFRGSREKPKS